MDVYGRCIYCNYIYCQSNIFMGFNGMIPWDDTLHQMWAGWISPLRIWEIIGTYGIMGVKTLYPLVI